MLSRRGALLIRMFQTGAVCETARIMTGRAATSRRAVAASVAAGVGQGRLKLEAVTVKSMNKLKRSRVVDGKIRTVTNAQYGRLLQLIIEQAHNAALAVFVERGCRFVEKNPPWFVQQEARLT